MQISPFFSLSCSVLMAFLSIILYLDMKSVEVVPLAPRVTILVYNDAVQCSEHPKANTSHSHHKKKIIFPDFQRLILTAFDSCFKAPQRLQGPAAAPLTHAVPCQQQLSAQTPACLIPNHPSSCSHSPSEGKPGCLMSHLQTQPLGVPPFIWSRLCLLGAAGVLALGEEGLFQFLTEIPLPHKGSVFPMCSLKASLAVLTESTPVLALQRTWTRLWGDSGTWYRQQWSLLR